MNSKKFYFRRLHVWSRAQDFVREIINITKNLNTNSAHFRLIEQLESASTSISMNIAEGSGRQSDKEFCRFLYIARGSIYETVTLIDTFRDQDWITVEQAETIEKKALELTAMLIGLINKLNSDIGR